MLTKFAGDYRLVHKLGQGGIKRMLKQHCDTRTGTGQQRTFDPPGRDVSFQPKEKNVTDQTILLNPDFSSVSSCPTIRER